MRIALTGTPGVGKTTLARHAAAQGWHVVDLKQWAANEGAIVGRDEADAADVIDVDLLAARVAHLPTRCIIEGHLSHLLPVDQVWVVRLDPQILEQRLQERGYPAAKVHENAEAEALDIILSEALATDRPVRQRDGTRRNPEALWKAFAEPGFEQLKGADLEGVDWSRWLLR